MTLRVDTIFIRTPHRTRVSLLRIRYLHLPILVRMVVVMRMVQRFLVGDHGLLEGGPSRVCGMIVVTLLCQMAMVEVRMLVLM